MTILTRLTIACILGASILISCGGGGGSSSTSATTPPTPSAPPPAPTPSNGVPVAIASSAIATITQGGQFTVSGTESSDPDEDDLSFTWIQIAGPNILLGGTIQTPNLTLTAPDVLQDTALTFELTASDGTDSNTDTVTVTAQPLTAPVTIRPVAPINADIASLIGITNEGADQYRLYWSDGLTDGNVIASQIFSDEDVAVGSQINGSFDLPQAGSSSSTQINGLQPISVIENGGTTYAPLIYFFENAVPHIGNLVGPLEGNLSPVDDPFFDIGGDVDFDQTPIGQNSYINVRTQSDGLFSLVGVDIFNPSGEREPSQAALFEMIPAGSDPSANIEVASINNPAVTAIGDGGYIVAWKREDINQSPVLRTVEAQIYTTENEFAGERITVEPFAGQSFFSIEQLDAATLENGNVLIVWIGSRGLDEDDNPTDFVLLGRIVSPDGVFLTDAFTVSESLNNQIETMALTLSNGDVLVFWDETDDMIRARTISLNGPSVSLGTEYELVNDSLANGYRALQTQTGRVIFGYNVDLSNGVNSSEFISFCPVGCE